MRAWTINTDIKNKIDIKKSSAKDVLRLSEINLPEIKENESLIKIESCGLNFNSVWSCKFYPVDPFSLVNGHVRRNKNDRLHIQDYFIPGSDACGKIVKTKANKMFKEGDEVVIHCAVIDENDLGMNDPMLSFTQSVWGYETNFGSFAEYAIVKNSQLLKKPKNLNSDICGSYMLTLGTAYRMLISKNGAQIKNGETCLVWGASGGLGVFAIQLILDAGAIPICVVSTKEKASYIKKFGAEKIICLEDLENKNFLENENFNMKSWIEMSLQIKKLTGENKIDVVFEHIGKDTMGLSIYLLKKGGRVVTCAATSGFEAKIDIRYIWMEMKKLIGSHFCNLNEAIKANELICEGKIVHEPSKIIKFDEIPEYLDLIGKRKTLGKIAVKL